MTKLSCYCSSCLLPRLEYCLIALSWSHFVFMSLMILHFHEVTFFKFFGSVNFDSNYSFVILVMLIDYSFDLISCCLWGWNQFLSLSSLLKHCLLLRNNCFLLTWAPLTVFRLRFSVTSIWRFYFGSTFVLASVHFSSVLTEACFSCFDWKPLEMVLLGSLGSLMGLDLSWSWEYLVQVSVIRYWC